MAILAVLCVHVFSTHLVPYLATSTAHMHAVSLVYMNKGVTATPAIPTKKESVNTPILCATSTSDIFTFKNT